MNSTSIGWPSPSPPSPSPSPNPGRGRGAILGRKFQRGVGLAARRGFRLRARRAQAMRPDQWPGSPAFSPAAPRIDLPFPQHWEALGDEGSIALHPVLGRVRLLRRLALAQLDAPDLAADRLRQLRHELDLARVLVRRRHPLDVVLQLLG